MLTLALMLAATDDINPYVGRVIFGIVVFILWGAGAMASAVRKQKQQERARQQKMWAEVQREMKGRPDAVQRQRRVPQPAVSPPVPPQGLPPGARGIFDRRVPPPPPPVRAIPVQRMAPPVMARPKATKHRRTPAAASVPPVPRPARVQSAAPPVPRGQVPASPAAPVRAATPPANFVALHRWLSAGTLRSQFILTEILQPPLGLREPREL